MFNGSSHRNQFSVPKNRLSRRRFIGGSVAAAVGSVSLGMPKIVGAQHVAEPIEALRPAGPLDEAYWRKARGQFNLVDGLTYMNNGTLGPVPRSVFEANIRYLRELSEDPRRTDGAYKNPQLEVVREKLARFVGVEADEIVLTRGTTEGMNIICHGLDVKEGDEVVMCSHEHPGGVQPYRLREKRHGIRVKMIDIPTPPQSADQIIDLYEKAITPRTRIIMVSHITYVTGLVMPIKELSAMAHRRGLFISADGAHPLGMIDINLRDLGCDFYASPGHKWLMAPDGTGMLYIKRDLQQQVWPNIVGGAWDNPKDGARRFERFNERNLPETRAMGDALDFHSVIGKKAIEARDRELSSRFRKGLQEIPGIRLHTPMDPSLNAALTTFSIREVPMANVVKVLMDRQRVHIRTMTTGNLNAVRLSTHFYNNADEVDLALEGIRHISENASKYMTG